MTKVSMTKARQDFTNIANRVIFGNERICIEKNNKPAMALVPLEDIERYWRHWKTKLTFRRPKQPLKKVNLSTSKFWQSNWGYSQGCIRLKWQRTLRSLAANRMNAYNIRLSTTSGGLPKIHVRRTAKNYRDIKNYTMSVPAITGLFTQSEKRRYLFLSSGSPIEKTSTVIWGNN